MILVPRVALLLAWALLGDGAAATVREAAEARVRDEVARHPEIADQATALARLAWPDEGVTDPLVSSLAREKLVLYADHALPMLRERIRNAPARFRADIVSALTETRLVVLAGRPSDYLPALDDALWYGPAESARAAMYSLLPYRFYRPALLPMIDRALEYPELLPVTIRSLAAFGDHRARFFLDDQMRHGPPDVRDDAASALATIGGLALEPLREAALADSAELRARAVDALLPVTTASELATLFEYLGRYPSDDPARTARVEQRALHLDALLQAQQAHEAASPTERD